MYYIHSASTLYCCTLINFILYCFCSQFLVTTFAGTGLVGSSGDNGPATNAQLNYPNGLLVDAFGKVYIADTNNHLIRLVALNGIITTYAGTGTLGSSGDGNAAIYARLNYPYGIALDISRNLFIADTNNNKIRLVSGTTGIITTVAGSGSQGNGGDGGQAVSAQFYFPQGVAVDNSGLLYISDTFNYKVRLVNLASGIITTFAGTGTYGNSGDGGLAIYAQMTYPVGVFADLNGYVYIPDLYNQKIRVVNSGVITTYAGNGIQGNRGDGGHATDAQLNCPRAVVVDLSGNMYVADTSNNEVRLIAHDIITTYSDVGGYSSGPLGDGGSATSAYLNNPGGLAVDQKGNLFIADTSNQRIRKITSFIDFPTSQPSTQPSRLTLEPSIAPSIWQPNEEVLVIFDILTTDIILSIMTCLCNLHLLFPYHNLPQYTLVYYFDHGRHGRIRKYW